MLSTQDLEHLIVFGNSSGNMGNQNPIFRLLKQRFSAFFDHFMSFQGSPAEKPKENFLIQATPPKEV